MTKKKLFAEFLSPPWIFKWEDLNDATSSHFFYVC